jgi:hypothetical protein
MYLEERRKMCFCEKYFRTYGPCVISVFLCILVVTKHKKNKLRQLPFVSVVLHSILSTDS